MALLQKAYLGSTALFRNTAWFEDDAWTIIDTPAAVTVTADTTAHTKGAYTEIIASTTANASFVFVRAVAGAANQNTATLLDLATGASGSEVVFASNIAVGGAWTTNLFIFGFPVEIASGSRISARIQSVVTGGKTATVQIYTVDAGDYATAPTSLDIIGADTTASKGGSFSGASGTWTQAIASTSQDYRGVVLVPSVHTNAATNFTATFEVGVGASGSEVAFGSMQARFGADETVGLFIPYSFLFGRAIPAGSRLAIKHNIAGNPDRYGFTLIGIP